MIRRLLSPWKTTSPEGELDSGRASILLPFLIIAAGLGVLAWRSYQLSVRMEQGATTVAAQYASYASEITARRVDAAAQAEIASAIEEWQQNERASGGVDTGAVQLWIHRHSWVSTVLYVPDADPVDSIYANEPSAAVPGGQRIAAEFYTTSGTVRYLYDPLLLLTQVRAVIRQEPLATAPTDSLSIQQPADVDLTRTSRHGLVRLADGCVFTTGLAAPFDDFAVRATVRMSYFGSGWANQRVISLVLSLVALALTGVGIYLTLRGTRKEAETARLRSALVANVSHELRTPLSMIRLGAETLQRATRLQPAERREIEGQILREALHLSHLVENVLDVARMQHQQSRSVAFGPVQPRELLTTLLSTYESWITSKGFTLSMRLQDDVEEQMWDREAVSRAVLNLIDNAVKYSETDHAIEVVLAQDEHAVIIEVRDQGLGIDSRDIAKIFEPYYRAKFSDTQTKRGAGLGLTLVQQIVASHDGAVEVESTPGVGSTFRLLFPRIPSPQQQLAPALVEAPDPA